MMQNSSSSSKANKQALSQLKNEVASELGITLKQGYNGDITSREAGRIGGNITRRVIEEMESQMSGR
ncbi:alpha/beta-type small acid-soluble spore protein [Christensenella sp. MSJ-20]|uniref:alpha/beta-type small acid-soluble spore protein n=1 Tax=Christensenella sp. MSJ-20 TaxID=2841518 RepID=UPI000D7A53C2|nr:MAG: acid-soluble spore protein [Bacillota bacterium]QWT55860.1 alpha/beta-type small acid-soluble spore protein [Christensenella sp. MSJ-20]